MPGARIVRTTRTHTQSAGDSAATHSIDRIALILCSATSHRALTQPSGVAAEPCPCISGMHTILDTKIPIATRAEPGTTRASASASSTAPLLSFSSPSNRFDLVGLRVDALQTFLTRDGPQLEQWRISVQLTNTTQRRFEQLQLDVLEEPAAISRLSTQCRTASLDPSQSVCLALELHVPEDRPALSLGLSISWFESKHWTSSHHIASITLPPWAAQGQHTSIQHPNATHANEPSNAPMLSQSTLERLLCSSRLSFLSQLIWFAMCARFRFVVVRSARLCASCQPDNLKR